MGNADGSPVSGGLDAVRVALAVRVAWLSCHLSGKGSGSARRAKNTLAGGPRQRCS